MDYYFWFWLLVAFIVGRLSKLKYYIGPDEEKYKKADFGIQTRRR
jgi:hypothetical protein